MTIETVVYVDSTGRLDRNYRLGKDAYRGERLISSLGIHRACARSLDGRGVDLFG